MTSRAVDEFFEGKPQSRAVFDVVAERIEGLGPSTLEVRSQISYGVRRKFAWFWLYNVTKKNPSGILHLMLALDHAVEDSHIRDVTQIGANRWNHQIVIRTIEDAESRWLMDLIELAYEYGTA